jgi:hypothetical protein
MQHETKISYKIFRWVTACQHATASLIYAVCCPKIHSMHLSHSNLFLCTYNDIHCIFIKCLSQNKLHILLWTALLVPHLSSSLGGHIAFVNVRVWNYTSMRLFQWHVVHINFFRNLSSSAVLVPENKKQDVSTTFWRRNTLVSQP